MIGTPCLSHARDYGGCRRADFQCGLAPPSGRSTEKPGRQTNSYCSSKRSPALAMMVASMGRSSSL
jgi:hypothetical protein